MRHLRAIVRAGMLMMVTLVMYAALILGLAFIFAFKSAAQRWRGFIFQTWAKTAASILGVKIAVRGNPPSLPFLLVSNHLSYIDVLVFASQLRCVFIARGDLASWPVIGSLCRGVGTIFIDRENRGDVARVNGVIDQAQRDGRGVVLFAEGTSTKGDGVLPFKSSLLEPAARASLPVAYAAISYRTLEGEKPAHLSVCWWGKMTFFKHVIGIMYLTEIQATVDFGAEPIQASNRKVLAEKLWTAVMKEFIPVVDSSEFNLQVADL
jgi:1-acyl-sn-glycerol-3-phosphate acyltransferase